MMMSTETRSYDVDVVDELVNRRIEEYDAQNLGLFRMRTRPHDQYLEMFDFGRPDKMLAEDFTYLTPEGLGVCEAIPWRNNESYHLNAFVRGVASMMSAYDPACQWGVSELLGRQVEAMAETGSYPLVDELFAEDYRKLVVAVLCGEEMTTWASMLAYIAGVYWILGFTRDVHGTATSKIYREKIFEFVMDRARRGTFD
jgi:hypothetical protein